MENRNRINEGIRLNHFEYIYIDIPGLILNLMLHICKKAMHRFQNKP
jgi:hypothetical protein